MALRQHTLDLTEDQLRAGRGVNAALAVAPRLKPDGWRLKAGQRLNVVAGRLAGPLGATVLKRRGIEVSSVSSDTCPVPIRLLTANERAKALVVDLHGGGWVLGSAALNDRLTGHLAQYGFAVASIDYRLLNDRIGIWMPDAVADCVAGLRWALSEGRQRFDVASVFVIGESAGAHLGALALLALRDQGGLAGMTGAVFVQGVFDLSGTPSARSAGPEALLFDGPNLQRDLGRLTPGLDRAERKAPDLSPLYADLHGLPPALFIRGSIDPFRDDSQEMAKAWARAGTATLLDVPEAPHGFQHFGAPSATLAQAFIRDWMSKQARSG